MQTASLGIFGASGYSGIELARLAAAHPRLTLRFLTSDRWEGQRAAERGGLRGDAGALTYVSPSRGLELAAACDVVCLATPAESSLELVPALLAAGVVVIDLSGAFRLKDTSLYPGFYRFAHPRGDLVATAAYGLPELFRARVPGARLVANPGCYATAAALSLAPLLQARLAEPTSLVASAASGVSGAGRKATEEFSFMEVSDDFRAYKVLGHQHTPEIEQTLSTVAGEPVELVFTPHLLPTKRGILCTSVARLRDGVTEAAVRDAYARAYSDEPLVELRASAEAVRVADVVSTPRCVVGVSVDAARRRVVAVSALDNLQKGAASQALQNVNLACGFAETAGL